MKKVLLVAVALALVFTAKVFADEAKATTPETKPTTTASAPAKTEPAKTMATAPAGKTTMTPTDYTVKGTVTSLDATTLKVKDNANKEWAFKLGTVNCKDYKVGDNVTVNYEKDNLKSIAKATK